VKYYSTLNELNDKKQAMVDTLQKIGMAIFFTSITTAIGFGALSMVKIQIVKEFGIFTALGVFFAFIITVFLIPSLLMLFEKTPQSTLDRYSTGFRVKIIKKFIKLVRVYPRLIVACGFVISFFGLFGALQINPHSKLLDDLRPGNPLLEDMQLAEEKMGSVLPVEIVIEVNEDGQFEDIQDVSVMSFLNDLAQYVSTIPEVGKVISVSDYLKEINQAMNDGNSDYYQIPQSREIISQYMLLYESEFESFINIDYTKLRIAAQINDIDSRRSAEIENDINKYITSQIPDGLGAEVTGTAFLALRTNNYLVNNLLASFFIALLIITFLMIFLFRSIKIALISILPNIIPMMIMAAVLGFFQIPLRPATAMTFAVAFGIAIDDTLHYLIRYRMELSHQHYRKANDATLLGTGIAMMSTTAILSAGFLVLTLSEFKPTIEFGMLSVITIIAALISDITFLPALLSQIKPKLESLND
jgi:predicted RND superfamily exporter protein